MYTLNKAELVNRLSHAKKQQDLETIMTLYHSDCVIEQPCLGVTFRGRDKLMDALVSFFNTFKGYSREQQGATEVGEHFISWGPATVALAGSYGGTETSGNPAEVMTFVLFKFLDNKIVYEGHYWDLGTICRAAGVSVESVWQTLAQ